MTIKEACIKVLTELGGRAPLKIICEKVQEVITFRGATPYNSICTELLTHPNDFRRTEGKKGYWELVSYQEEVAGLKQAIKDRDEEISFLKAEIEMLKNKQTVEDFVRQELSAAKQLFWVHRENADPLRQVLGITGFVDEASKLAAWMEHKENRLVNAVEKIAEKPMLNVEVKAGAHAQISEQGITNQFPLLSNG